MTAIGLLAAAFTAIVIWDLVELCRDLCARERARDQFWRDFDSDGSREP